jgi:hypothetical protein
MRSFRAHKPYSLTSASDGDTSRLRILKKNGRKFRTIQKRRPMISVRPLCKREVRRLLCASRPNPSVPSPGPRWGLIKKRGLIAVGFLGIIPPGGRGSRRAPRFDAAGAPASRRTRNVPQRRRRACGQHTFSIVNYPETPVRNSGNLGIPFSIDPDRIEKPLILATWVSRLSSASVSR